MRDVGLGTLEEVRATLPSFDRDSARATAMTNAHLGTIGILCGVLGTSLLCGGDFSSYRGFQFGMNLSVAAKQAGMKPADARLVRQRPAVIQELDWLPGPPIQADPIKADPVQ